MLEEFAPLKEAADACRAYNRTVPRIAWPEGARVAVNFTADFDAMLLRRVLNEPPMQLAKGEFGGRVGVWRLLDLFESHAVPATFFVPGRICELYPSSVRAIAEAGHEVADHMWEHQVPKDRDVERAHLLRAADALERLTGKRPLGTRSWHSTDILQELGFIYNSHNSEDVLPYLTSANRAPFVNLPFHWSVDDAMYFSMSWLNTGPESQRVTDTDRVFDLWWSAFEQHYQDGTYFNICLHPFVSGRALRIAMLDRLISRMKALPGVWFSTCVEVAQLCIATADKD